MAVDDCGGFVYWVNDHNNIEQRSLNGSNTKTLLETGKLNVIWKLIHRIIVTEYLLYHIVIQHPLYHLCY